MSNVLTMAPPGRRLEMRRMPGHWVLVQMGKRVLRPGGMELTRRMLAALHIRTLDDVVEFAPGIGATARLTLSLHPSSYTAVERDEAAAKIVSGYLTGPRQKCKVGSADHTGLEDERATVVYGEAMLTMQTAEAKHRIVREAHRLLRRDGRYGIHELCLVPGDLDEVIKQDIHKALSQAIHVGARPLTVREWRNLFESEGFQIQTTAMAPMHLLEPWRLIQDEGLRGALSFVWNVVRNSEARRRVRAMRAVFRRYHEHLAAVSMIAVKR